MGDRGGGEYGDESIGDDGALSRELVLRAVCAARDRQISDEDDEPVDDLRDSMV